MENKELFEIALKSVDHHYIENYGEYGQVACAILSEKGNIYTGLCLDLSCSLGMCAEQAAIAEMLKHGETKIKKLIAVHEGGIIYPPCGRCREFIYEVNRENLNATILLDGLKEVKLSDLLPSTWMEHRIKEEDDGEKYNDWK